MVHDGASRTYPRIASCCFEKYTRGQEEIEQPSSPPCFLHDMIHGFVLCQSSSTSQNWGQMLSTPTDASKRQYERLVSASSQEQARRSWDFPCSNMPIQYGHNHLLVQSLYQANRPCPSILSIHAGRRRRRRRRDGPNPRRDCDARLPSCIAPWKGGRGSWTVEPSHPPICPELPTASLMDQRPGGDGWVGAKVVHAYSPSMEWSRLTRSETGTADGSSGLASVRTAAKS